MSDRVRPLTEGYVVKGGRNQDPSQIKTRPAPPGGIPRRRGSWPAGKLEAGGYRPAAGTIAKVLEDDRE